MKRIERMLSFGLMLLALCAANAYAESPREQFKQMVEQLQQSPGDTALREKIIKLAQALKPAPAVPEEAERRMARGEAAFEAAKDVNGYADAMREFQAASNLAPWYSDAYFNLGIAQEKAGKVKAAMESFRFYLLAAPDGKDAADVKKRIYKLEYAAEQAAKVPAGGETFRDCADCPEMVAIPGKDYAIGKYEVTQAQWQAVMGNNPSKFRGSDRPVEQVSWNDVQEYIRMLNQKTGKQYRLPKEAEWEVACQGGTQTEYCGGNNINAVAWYDGNSGEQTHPVGQKQANGYGLYDMSGNVWEWMDDCWEGDCARRVCRGGSWSSGPQIVRAAYRVRDVTSIRGIIDGFRLARTLP